MVKMLTFKVFGYLWEWEGEISGRLVFFLEAGTSACAVLLICTTAEAVKGSGFLNCWRNCTSYFSENTHCCERKEELVFLRQLSCYKARSHISKAAWYCRTLPDYKCPCPAPQSCSAPGMLGSVAQRSHRLQAIDGSTGTETQPALRICPQERRAGCAGSEGTP